MGNIEMPSNIGDSNSPGVLFGILVSSDFGEIPQPCKGVIIHP